MPDRNIQSVTILRAATADEESLHIYPPAIMASDVMHGADLLSDVALRTCSQLLSDIEPPMRDTVGLVIGTALGCLETDRIFDRSRREAHGRYASPAAFARTLPSTVAAEITLKFSLHGPSLVVSSGATSTSLAIYRAMRWMEHFQLSFCIAGGMDWLNLAAPNAPHNAHQKPPQVAAQNATKGPASTARGDQRESLENDPKNSAEPQRGDRRFAKSCVASLLLLARDVPLSAGEIWRIQRTSLTHKKRTTPADDDLHRLAGWIQNPQLLTLSNGLKFTRRPCALPADQ